MKDKLNHSIMETGFLYHKDGFDHTFNQENQQAIDVEDNSVKGLIPYLVRKAYHKFMCKIGKHEWVITFEPNETSRYCENCLVDQFYDKYDDMWVNHRPLV